jgi:intracellular septation protein
MPIDKMQWLSLGLIVVFGGATLLLQDERFIKLKPSLLYGLFGLGLLIPQLFMGTRLIEKLLADKLQLPEAAWARLNGAWGLFFLFMAGLNLYVAAAFSTDTWVDFKLFGTMGLMLVFVLAQGVYISRFQPQDPP